MRCKLVKKHSVKLREIFFYMGMFIQLFYTTQIITINSYENSSILVLAITVCFIITILQSNFNRDDFIVFFILVLCSILHFLLTDDTNLFRIIMMLFAGKNISSEHLKKFLVISYPMLFLSVWFLSTYGGLNTVFQVDVWRISLGWELRYTLGFDGATRMMFMWICCIVSIHIYMKTLNVLRDAIFLLISIYLFNISSSYTGIFCSILAIISPYIIKFWVDKKSSVLIKYFVRGSLILVLVLTAVATFTDISSTRLGSFLNGRTYFLNYLFRNGIYPSLFGGKIPTGIKGLDNSYFYNFYLLGIIPMLFMIFAIWRLGKLYCKNRDVMGSACTVTFIFLAYVTQTFEHPFLNYFLFLIMENWNQFMNLQFDNKNQDEMKKKRKLNLKLLSKGI